MLPNSVVEKQFIEPQKDGDPFEVSDVDTMLAYLASADDVEAYFGAARKAP